MALYYQDLDDYTRQLMLDEMDYDVAHNQLDINSFLSGQGQRDYPNLLRRALEIGNDETLAQNLGVQSGGEEDDGLSRRSILNIVFQN